MSQIDRLLSGTKWRCTVCNHTEPVLKGEDLAINLQRMESHVKAHKGVVMGFNDPAVKNMHWQKFIEPVDMEMSSFS